MPEASRGRISTNINERFATMTVKGGGYKRESVVVIVDATGDELNLEGLDWALLNVVEPDKNELIVLGIFQEVQPYGKAWEFCKTVTCCSSRASRDKKLNQKISHKMEAFNLGLQDSVLLQQKDTTKVHVRVTAGFTPLHNIALQETSALSASWVVIDRTLKTNRKFFAEQMTCNVVLMKGKGEAEVLRIHQDQLGKSPASLDDMSLDSIMLADISRAILAREREQLLYSDACGEVPHEATGPSSWKTQHQQGPAPLPIKRPSYTSPKVRTPAREFYSGSFSSQGSGDPSIQVSWFDPAHDASTAINTSQNSSTLDHDSDTEYSYTTPSPMDARASANSRTLGQAVRNRFLPPPRVSAEPPPPAPPPSQPVEVPAATTDGYSSDSSSQSELESDHGGRTPRGLSTILQDQRSKLGLKHLTVTAFGDETPLEEPPSPTHSVLSIAPTEEPDMPQPLPPPTKLDLRQRAASASSSSSPRSASSSSSFHSPSTALYFGSSRHANKRNQQPPGAMPRLAASPAPTTRFQGRASSVRSDSPAMSTKSAASPSPSLPSHYSTPARSTRSNRSSSRDSSATLARAEEVYPRLGHQELLSPPRFNMTET